MKRTLLFLMVLIYCANAYSKLPDLIPYRKGNLWGYCDSTKKIIIPCLYDTTFLFETNETIKTSVDGKKGTLQKNGSFQKDDSTLAVISPPNFYIGIEPYPYIWANSSACVWNFGPNNKLYVAQNENSLFGYKRGNKLVIPYQFTEARDFSEGLAAVMTKSGRWGFIDTTGKVIFTIESAIIVTDYKNGIAVFTTANSEGQGIVDGKGNMLLPPLADYLEPAGNLFIARHKEQFLLLNRTGKMANPNLFVTMEFHETYFLVQLDNRTWGTLNKKGKVLIPIKYSMLYADKENLMAADNGEKWGFLNKSGKTIIPFNYPQPENGGFSPNSLCHFKSLGYIDVHGTEYWEEEKKVGAQQSAVESKNIL